MPERNCPYLGLDEDPVTRTAFPSLRNCCHRAKPAQKIDHSYQKNTCFSQDYQECPIYQEGWKGRLPPELRASTSSKGSLWRRVWAVVVLGVVAGGIFISGRMGWLFPMNAWFSPPTATAEVMTSVPPTSTTVMPTQTPVPTPTPVATETPEKQATNTPQPTPTITSVPTSGPGVETYFGPEDQFLIHIVQEGESFYSLAAQYNTSEEVIKATNQLLVEDSLWKGTNLLLVPGQTEVGDLPKFDVLYISQTVRVSEIADNYEAAAADIRYYNELGAGDLVKPNRWLIIPVTE